MPRIALATISIDSTIKLWSIKDERPFWSGHVPREGLPSSIDFLDGGLHRGLLVGRKQGTVLQLLSIVNVRVAATIKFTTGAKDTREDNESVFCHVAYDPQIKTLWVAHSARSSLFAVRISYDVSLAPLTDSEQQVQAQLSQQLQTPRSPIVDQIIEFPTPMQIINMAILMNDGHEAGNAVASFVMHQRGVDQLNISMTTFENALAGTEALHP